MTDTTTASRAISNALYGGKIPVSCRNIRIGYTRVETAADVTDEIRTIVIEEVDGCYGTITRDPHDVITLVEESWPDLISRIDGSELADGTMIDLGDSMVSPAIDEIKRIIQGHWSSPDIQDTQPDSCLNGDVTHYRIGLRRLLP